MNELIQIPASVVNMKPRADRSWKIEFETRELTGDDVKILADNLQGEGWMVFKPNDEVTTDDIPEVDAEPGTKTPSQRLRATIMVLWRQRGSKGDRESFYRTYMEQLIDYTKSKLEKEG